MRFGNRPWHVGLLLVTLAAVWPAWSASVAGQIAVRNQGFVPFSDAPIFYRGEVHDPVAVLQGRLDRGETTLRFEPTHGYLQSVLDELRIPVSSQTLVFSKTSSDKVIVAIVTGTWCPNCHDEAQYLVQLYKQYRDRGPEIVALDFEEPEQQDELARVKAFTTQYGVEYTYVISGAPAEMWEKVPQANNLNTWPATFFIGKDGRVKNIHAGFAAPASGVFHEQLKQDFTSTIERLLAEPSATQN